MKEKKSPPVRLKQSKITAFCLTSEGSRENSQVNRKRKNAAEVAEVHKTPIKRASRSDFGSPDLFQVSPERNPQENRSNRKKNEVENETKNDFENFVFDDFENDPFLSPRKKESPKKNILTENVSANEMWMEEPSDIDFETSVKCKVIKATFLTEKCFEQVLLLNDVKLNKRGVCKLRDVWTSFAFSPDDVVSIQAAPHSKGEWVVDNKNGHVILHPDVTVSTTTLTKSMFCMRQGILSNYFKEMDSEGSSRMLIGRLVHELFQESLKSGVSSNEELNKIVADLMQSRENMHNFFFSDMNLSDIEKEMKKFIPRVRNFLQVYVNKETAPAGGSFEGTINDVIDIEELVRSPILGFQGRVDVTVKMTSKRGEEVAPLELKTGKASFSNEHRSQLVMYILLMNELGRKVNSGLLLYLREDILEEILPQRDEIRNIFLLRNHFVDIYKRFGASVLPEPIRNTKYCPKCPQFRTCTTYLKNENCDRFNESHPLRCVEVPDLTPDHVDYFLRWSKMLCLEYQEVVEQTSDEDEISGLQLQPNVESFNEEFKCTFRRMDSGERTFRPGTFVHIMDGKNNRMCTGRVLEITDSHVSIVTEARLDEFSDVYKLVVFKSKFLSIYLSNLGWFLNEKFENLRQLIVDKRTPVFEKNFDKTDFQEKCLKFLLDLNKQQQKAVLKSILCRDYLLIKGPPGTGKTQTIVTLIKILLALNKTVLIASHTHSSVDNILLRLEGVDYLRLGSLRSIRKEIHKHSYSYLIENCSSVDDVKKLFDRKLIASTCLGIDSDFVRKMKVEYCIVDESSQVLQPEILRPLFCCEKFILVGDEDQLPPIVRNPEAKRLGMAESLFEWLKGEHSIVRLSLQYRMNSVINSLANAVTYGGLMECGNEEVAKATMKIPDREVYLRQDEWIVEVLSDDLEKSVVFVDTSEYFRGGNKKSNEQRSSLLEVNIILKLITCLVEFGCKKESIGVVTPFWDQITLLKGKLEESKLQEIELNTVEQYQGRDKEVILFSCTKENKAEKEASESELLNDEKRLTVALTRAKHKLIIVGDKQTVARYKPFQKLLQSMSESQFYCLSDGQKNFFWENFVN